MGKLSLLTYFHYTWACRQRDEHFLSLSLYLKKKSSSRDADEDETRKLYKPKRTTKKKIEGEAGVPFSTETTWLTPNAFRTPTPGQETDSAKGQILADETRNGPTTNQPRSTSAQRQPPLDTDRGTLGNSKSASSERVSRNSWGGTTHEPSTGWNVLGFRVGSRISSHLLPAPFQQIRKKKRKIRDEQRPRADGRAGGRAGRPSSDGRLVAEHRGERLFPGGEGSPAPMRNRRARSVAGARACRRSEM